MEAIEEHGADHAWRSAVDRLKSESRDAVDSRCGSCYEWLNAMIALENPRSRWVLSRNPALNIPFALAEIIWILSGRNDSAFLNYFNSNLPRFAGSGDTYHGAYGYRLRVESGFDQLKRAYDVLSTKPESRQVVLQIWIPNIDFPGEYGEPLAEDIPCNICSLLKVRNGRLHWTQIMRSNDVFLGLPYNLVQFTTLHEIMAGWLDLDLGPYVHYSDSLHLYDTNLSEIGFDEVCVAENLDRLSLDFEQTAANVAVLEGLVEAILNTRHDSQCLLSKLEGTELSLEYRNWAAILVAEACRRRGDLESAIGLLETCRNPVLRQGCERWFSRFER